MIPSMSLTRKFGLSGRIDAHTQSTAASFVRGLRAYRTKRLIGTTRTSLGRLVRSHFRRRAPLQYGSEKTCRIPAGNS